MNLDARATLYRELGSLLKSGLPLVQALEVLIGAPELRSMRSVLAAVQDRVREGTSLAAALTEASDQVRPFEVAAVEVGEKAGTIDVVLNRLADFLEEQQSLRDRVYTAMIYPTIVVGAVILVVIFMLGVMLPRFARLFAEARIEVPTITTAVLMGGRMVVGLLVVLVPVVVACAVWISHRRRRIPEWDRRIDRWTFRCPLYGQAYGALCNLRFARTLALLMAGGVELVDGLRLAGRATSSPWISQLAEVESEALRHGSSLAESIRRIPPLGTSLPGWIQAGEASGDLQHLLEKASERYQRQWDRTVNRFVQALEPTLILLVGVLVLTIALAILTPVLSLNSVVM